MSDFKPLRRKLGVLTLLMACAAMSLWFRSEWIADTFTIPYRMDDYLQVALSARNVNLGLLSIHGRNDRIKTQPRFWMTDAAEPLQSIPAFATSATPCRGWRRFLDLGDTSVSTGFELQPFSVLMSTPTMRTAAGGEYPVRFSCLTVPGWPIVLFLAVFSAYLLLSERRGRAPVPEHRPACLPPARQSESRSPDLIAEYRGRVRCTATVHTGRRRDVNGDIPS